MTQSTANKKGFTLLIAVFISALVLSIGLSLSLIAVKELGISSVLRESVLAHYAAESGIECARYWSIKQDTFNYNNPNTSVMRCNNKNIYVTDRLEPSLSEHIFNFSFDHGGAYETDVQITSRPSAFHDETIKAFGYNTLSSNDTLRKVQRFKEINIFGLCEDKADIVLLIDRSHSVMNNPPPGGCDINSSGLEGCEWFLLVEASKRFVQSMPVADSLTRIGVVSFGGKGNPATIQTFLSGNSNSIVGALDDMKSDYPSVPSNQRGTYTWTGIGETNNVFETSSRKNNNEHPNITLLLTDGRPHDGGTDGTGDWPNVGVLTRIAANNLKIDQESTIFAYGVGVRDNCVTDLNPNPDCGEYLTDEIVGPPGDTDHLSPSPLYYVGVNNFVEFSNALDLFSSCVTPIDDK